MHDDEQGQQHEQVTVAAAERPGNKWGDPISEERQRELQQMLDAWNTPDADHGERKGPFDGVALTGADVSWLAERALDAGVQLSNLHLEGANLSLAHLEGANLSNTYLNESTALKGAMLGSERNGYASLWNVRWNSADLTVVDWASLRRLGDDEAIAQAPTQADRTIAINRATQAYQALGEELTSQGVLMQGARFLVRARQLELQVLRGVRRSERSELLRTKQFGAWAFYGVLNMVAGYAREPVRIFKSYLVVVAFFALVYFGVTHSVVETDSHILRWDEALVLSLSAFHGRGFFPTTITLGDWIGRIAALEAAFGAFTEGVFIATFTRRFIEGTRK